MQGSKFLTESDIIGVIQEVVDYFLIPKFHELKMDASGEWIKNLEVQTRGNNEAVIRGRDYTEFLTKGRGPNSDQSADAVRRWAVWAGKTFMADWVRDKGLSLNPIAVAYNIAKKGTSWKRKGGSDLLEVLTEPRVIKYIQDRLGQIVTPRLAEELRRNADILRG